MKKKRFLLPAVALTLIFGLSGCLDNGGTGSEAAGGSASDNVATGSTSPAEVATAVISGKVSLSSLLGKPGTKLQKMHSVPKGKPGSSLHKAGLRKAGAAPDSRFTGLPTRMSGDSVANAVVQLFDADHPEWLFPVAESPTDSNGNYTLETMINAEKNPGATYKNGDPIPAGNYTLVAIEKDADGNVLSVAQQSVVNEFSGQVTNDLVPQEVVETPPKVLTMFGVEKNTDGTQTWGGADLTVYPNTALQITFSMAIDRQTVEQGIVIEPAVNGFWAISPDGLTATLYLDEGEQLAQGQSYTVTVKGDNGSDPDNALKNILGVALEEDAVGYFSVPTGAEADLQAPTAQMVSPSLSEIASPDGIDLITPIRIGSTEVMDVNDLLLTATPSLGARPNVIYLGQNNGLYEYEFILGEPLKVATTYDVQIAGGKDLAGNEMNPLTVSFTTVSATEGVVVIPEDASEEEVVQLTKLANAQAAVKDVFGKWYRAMNDRSLAQMQSLMTIDFALEYNTADGYDDNDINRDGRLDLNEFSDMLSKVFLIWEACGTTMTGDVIGDINVVGDEADFEFKLIGESELATRECAEVAPKESMFAKLQRINGAWYMLKASQGIDTRNEEVQQAGVIDLLAPEHGAVLDMGGPDGQEQTMTFSWTEVPEAASYVMIFVDDRDPKSGFAMILPPSYTEFDIPPNDALFSGDNPVIADVSKNFGFTREFDPRPGVEINWQVAALGSNTVQDILNDRATSLPKDVIAVSRLSRFKLAGEYQELSVTVAKANCSGELDPMGDNSAICEVVGDPVTFSEFIDGYDVDDAEFVQITVQTPRAEANMGIVNVSGNTFQHYTYAISEGVGSVFIQLNQGNNWIEVADQNFYANAGGGDPGACDPAVDPNCGTMCDPAVDPNCGTMCDPAVDPNCGTMCDPAVDPNCGTMCDPAVDPNCGTMCDPAVDPNCGTMCDPAVDPNCDTVISQSADGAAPPPTATGGADYQLVEYFNIQTTGGIPPVVAITSVADQDGNVISDDGWSYYRAPAATSVVISGTVNVAEFEFRELNLNLWNDRLGANSFRRVELDASGNFSVEVEIYQGENWIDVGGEGCQGGMCNWYSANLGVQTDLGTEWVPPVVISEVAYVNGDADGVVTERDTWGNGGNWEVAPADPDNPAVAVVIRGKLEYAEDPTGERSPRYNVGSEGGWFEDRLAVEPDGSFELVVELYTGWNNIGITDVNDNWYNVNIFAQKAKKVIRPELTFIDGVDAATALNEMGEYVTDQCSVTIEGTALVGEVQINWNGSGELTDGSWNSYWEGLTTETDADGNFSATLPLIGGSAYNWVDNFVDINDANWNWLGLRVVTTADCEYTPPKMNVSEVVATMDPADPADDAVLSLVESWGEGGRYGLVTDADPNGYDQVPTGSVVIKGTSTVPNRQINVENGSCGVNTKVGSVTSSDVADANGEYPWSIEVMLYPGGNNISLFDGPNWYSIDVQANNSNEPPVPPLSITSVVDESGNTLSPVVDAMAPVDDPCGGSNNRYDAGSATVVTISGVTSGRAPGEGEWRANGDFGRFPIAEDGSYSFEITLYDGFNWVDFNDADWNSQGLEIMASNGVQRPQFVVIESPTQNATVDGGSLTVTGVILSDPEGTGEGFQADFVSGFVSSCGDDGCAWTEFSSDPNAAQWGALPVILGTDADGNTTFTFEGASVATVTDPATGATRGAWTNVEVRADGSNADGSWAGHGHAIEFNNDCTDCSARIWKPGQVAKPAAVRKGVSAIVNQRARLMESRRAR